MNALEHLLTCLAEECGEVAKECHKSLRFGLDDHVTLDPNGPRNFSGPTNRDKIVGELNDIFAVVQMLIDRGAIPHDWEDKDRQDAKASRVARYMDYASRIGTLQ